MMTKEDFRPDFIVLLTVPVMPKNGVRSLKANALLDDASTKTYFNEDVVVDLGLQGKLEKVTVNVVNGQSKHSTQSQLRDNRRYCQYECYRLHSEKNHRKHDCHGLE